MPASSPSVDLLLRACDHLAASDWKAAHDLVQPFDADPIAAWLHAVAHKVEGDLANARYWYARCSAVCTPSSRDDAPAVEVAAIRALLLGKQPSEKRS